MFDSDFYRDDPYGLIPILSGHLVRGELALVLGAGALNGLGMPQWWKLVHDCIEIANLDKDIKVDKYTSSEKLREAMENVEDHAKTQSQYLEWVKNALYSNDDPTESHIVTQELLLAVGSLVMGAMRGKIEHIITLNYDDIIEWYLEIHGFCPQVITSTPYLARNADVSIVHAHGFLPKYTKRYEPSKKIVLSQIEYDKALGDKGHDLYNLLTQIIERKVCLFVGVNRKDPVWGQKLANAVVGERKAGFWFFEKGTQSENDTIINWSNKRNIMPILLNDYNEIPKFLLKVCQEAALNVCK